MCGVTAIVRLQESVKAEENGIESMKERLMRAILCMHYRGPDHQGLWLSQDQRVGLAHTRLATRDLSCTGHQPLHDDQRMIHVVVNGELYYDPDERQELIKRRIHQFASTSDSEMAIGLYKRYGRSFVQHLRGEFSLVLYDGQKDCLIACRDRYGVKPLYWARSGNELLIASQMKSLHALGKQCTWDLDAVAANSMHWGVKTFFHGIQRLRAGHTLLVDGQRDDDDDDASSVRRIHFAPYWQPVYPVRADGIDSRSIDEMVIGLRDRLVEAVRIRLESSDVPVACLLSGGIDSSAVVGIAHHVQQERKKKGENNLTCFTINFAGEHDGELDESMTAMRTAKRIGVPYVPVTISEQDFADEFEETAVRAESMVYDLHHVAKKILSKSISSQGFRVVLNGDGSDELFSGYSFLKADRLSENDFSRTEKDESMDEALRTRLFAQEMDAEWYGFPLREAVKSKAYDAEGLREYKDLIGPGMKAYALLTFNDRWQSDSLMAGRPTNGLRSTLADLGQEWHAKMKEMHPLHRSLLLWNASILPNVIIASISDGPEMAHSVESRPPFLDHIVCEYVNRLPPDVKVRFENGRAIEKWIFREAVKPFVTNEVYMMEKKAFAAPWRWQRNGPLRKKLERLTDEQSTRGMAFVDHNKVRQTISDAFDEQDQEAFRQIVWLAQMACIGRAVSAST